MIKSSNRPYQTAAPVTQTLGASPATYTNNSGCLQYVSVAGGLAVSVSLLGLSSMSLSAYAAYMLRPGDVLTIAYTTAPTVITLNLL